MRHPTAREWKLAQMSCPEKCPTSDDPPKPAIPGRPGGRSRQGGAKGKEGRGETDGTPTVVTGKKKKIHKTLYCIYSHNCDRPEDCFHGAYCPVYKFNPQCSTEVVQEGMYDPNETLYMEPGQEVPSES
jgi:hypothetical protein